MRLKATGVRKANGREIRICKSFLQHKMWFCLWEGTHVFLKGPLYIPHSSPKRHVEKQNERCGKITWEKMNVHFKIQWIDAWRIMLTKNDL